MAVRARMGMQLQPKGLVVEAQWMQPPYGINGAKARYYCNTCHGFFTVELMREHEQFHRSYTNRTDGKVSNVSWCDPGSHSFKAGSPGSVHWQGEQVGDDGGTTRADMDACRNHNPFRANPDNIIKELNSDYPVEHNND